MMVLVSNLAAIGVAVIVAAAIAVGANYLYNQLFE